MVQGRTPMPESMKKPKESKVLATVPSEKLSPPDYLEGVALSEWHSVIRVLETNGMLSSVDTTALAIYCETVQKWRETQDVLKIEPNVITMSNGAKKLHPYVRMQEGLFKQIVAFQKEFGLTPNSRKRMRVETGKKEEKKSALALFLSRDEESE